MLDETTITRAILDAYSRKLDAHLGVDVANAVHGGHRMGPVFGGMLRSGRKAARTLLAGLRA